MSRVSVVVETYNLGARATESRACPARLGALLAALSHQVEAVDAEVVITHSGLHPRARAEARELLGRAIVWTDVPRDADYYEHKNCGFDASTGGVVAFIDADCLPVPDWLGALLAPIREGATVAAGGTTYAGRLGELGSRIDFPYYDLDRARRRAVADAPLHVRNFFANNVAFERSTFGRRHYPEIAEMFHGQCQVLGLQLLAENVPIRFAPKARATHAWPDGPADWLRARLLRGADTVSLLPFLTARYMPRAAPLFANLGPLPALALLVIRGADAAWAAVRQGPVVPGVALAMATTIVDGIGAAFVPRVHRRQDR